MIPVLDLSPEIAEIRKDIDKAMVKVINNTSFIMGEEVRLFEEEAAEYLGTRYAFGVNSGTDALVIGLRALGIGEGDEVITSPFSFFATAESISSVGAKPVFADINSESFNIDPESVEKKITSKTRAIMPVHLYGRPCAMTRIRELAEKHNLKIVEDCAQSFGATYAGSCSECENGCPESVKSTLKGCKAGTIGDVGAYSFFPSKNLGCFGDGGLVVTDDEKIAEVLNKLRLHGAGKKYHNEMIGYNSRLDTLQAAVLRVKLPHIDRWNNGRRAAAGIYNMLLEQRGLSPEFIQTPREAEGHVFHQYTIRLKLDKLSLFRDDVREKLKERGVSSMVYYPVPQDMLPVYTEMYEPCPVSKQISQEVLSLPIWPLMKIHMQEKVVDALENVVQS